MGISNSNTQKQPPQFSQLIKSLSTFSKRLEIVMKNLANNLIQIKYERISLDLDKLEFNNLKEMQLQGQHLKGSLSPSRETARISEQQQARQYKKEISTLLHLIFLLKASYKLLTLSEDSYRHYGLVVLDFIRKKTKGNSFLQKLLVVLLGESVDGNMLSCLTVVEGKSILQNLLQLDSDCQMALVLVQILELLIAQSQAFKNSLVQIYYRCLLTAQHNPIHHIQNIKSNIFNREALLNYFHSPHNSHFYIIHHKNTSQPTSHHRTFCSALSQLLQSQIAPYIFNRIFAHTTIAEFLCLEWLDEKSDLVEVEWQYLWRMQQILVVLEVENVRKVVQETFEAIICKKSEDFSLLLQRCFTTALFVLFQYTVPTPPQLEKVLPNFKEHQSQLLIVYIQLRHVYHQQYQRFILSQQPNLQKPVLTIVSTDHVYSQMLIRSLQEAGIAPLFKQVHSHLLLFEEQLYSQIKGQESLEHEQEGKRLLLAKILHQTSTFFDTFTNAFIDLSPLLLHYHLQSSQPLSQKILECLLSVLDGCQAITFKRVAEKLVKGGQVIKFIIEKGFVQNKKMHNRSGISEGYAFPVFSDFLKDEVQSQVFEKLILFNEKEMGKREFRDHFSATNLNEYIGLLKRILYYLESHPYQQGKLQPQMIAISQCLVNVVFQTHNLQFVLILQQFEQKVMNLSAKLKLGLNKIHQKFSEHSHTEKRSDMQKKKRDKMRALKQKQKVMLQCYKMQEEKVIRVECIVCKNTKQGYPYLLAHFRYNNFFENGILRVGDRPFLEFSTCGHYIHEQCLQESHKSQFRIWYPCILCKSICNILLPSNEDSQQKAQIERSVCFLKNLAALYHFFYKDRQSLLEFTLQTFTKIFPLLFKSLTYLVALYPLLNIQHFLRSQYPIARFIFKMLVLSSEKVKVEIFVDEATGGEEMFCVLYGYVSERLRCQISKRQMIDKDRAKLLSKQTLALVDSIIKALAQNREELSFQNFPTDKSYRQIAVSHIIKPDNDLYQLQQQSRTCKSCNSNVMAQEICLLCQWNCCRNCLDVRKVHSKEIHLGESIFLRTDSGKYIYIHDDLTAEFQSLYIDFLGQEVKQQRKANINEYHLNNEAWQTVVNDLLANRIHREIMKLN